VQLIDDQDARERLGRRNAEHIAAREATTAGHGLAVLLAQELERA
jgi:hypothetical protein